MCRVAPVDASTLRPGTSASGVTAWALAPAGASQRVPGELPRANLVFDLVDPYSRMLLIRCDLLMNDIAERVVPRPTYADRPSVISPDEASDLHHELHPDGK